MLYYCLQENLSEVDPGSRLGLGPECVESYRVGDQLRTIGSRLHAYRSFYTDPMKSCLVVHVKAT